jgi:hypothetical protein
MVYDTRDCWVSEFCPLSGILKDTKEHTISEDADRFGFRKGKQVQKPDKLDLHKELGVSVLFVCMFLLEKPLFGFSRCLLLVNFTKNCQTTSVSILVGHV